MNIVPLLMLQAIYYANKRRNEEQHDWDDDEYMNDDDEYDWDDDEYDNWGEEEYALEEY